MKKEKAGKKTSGGRRMISAEEMPQYLFNKLEEMYDRQDVVNALLHKRLLKAITDDGEVEEALNRFSQGMDGALNIVSQQNAMLKDWNG